MAQKHDAETTVFSNRDEAIPVMSFSSSSSQGKEQSTREKIKNSHAVTKIREKLRIEDKKSESSPTMQDRLMNVLLQQIIPSEDSNGNDQMVDKRSRTNVDRPGFSLATMSTNFRRFNARVGVAFVFQNQLMHLFSWQKPTQTMSFLAIYTFTCVDPSVLPVIPLAMTLYFVMLPSFLTRHPPPPSLPPTELYPLTGPPLAPPQLIKPAPELSKDSFRNMRDLQNSMEDLSRLHDLILAKVAPLTNFSSEQFSSTLFIGLFATCNLLFLTAHLIPWRYVFLIGGWAVTIAGHPTVKDFLESPRSQALMANTIISSSSNNNNNNNNNSSSSEGDGETLLSRLEKFAASDISVDPAPERREVEIFELQHRPLTTTSSAAVAASSSDKPTLDEWEPVLFSPVPYTTMSPARLASEGPHGSRLFEEVEPPNGWKWADKKWSLDLMAKEWVDERCITGVDIEAEGGRWVVDVVKGDGGDDDGDVVVSNSIGNSRRDKKRKSHTSGEWRRRRWIRVVERVQVTSKDGD